MKITVKLDQDWEDENGKVYLATGDQIRAEYREHMLTALEQCHIPLDMSTIKWSWFYMDREFCWAISAEVEPL